MSIRTSQIWSRWFNSAFASRSLQTAIRVANFDSEVPALNRRELGANPRQPTILRSQHSKREAAAPKFHVGGLNSPHVRTSTRQAIFRIRGEITIMLRFERRVCRWESCRMHQFMGMWLNPNSRGSRLRIWQPWGCKSLHAHHFAHVVQCRDGALKTRTVSVQVRPWAPTACSPRQRRSAQTGKVAGSSPVVGTILDSPSIQGFSSKTQAKRAVSQPQCFGSLRTTSSRLHPLLRSPKDTKGHQASPHENQQNPTSRQNSLSRQ